MDQENCRLSDPPEIFPQSLTYRQWQPNHQMLNFSAKQHIFVSLQLGDLNPQFHCFVF